MGGRHEVAKSGPSTDLVMACVVLTQVAVLVAVVMLALAGA